MLKSTKKSFLSVTSKFYIYFLNASSIFYITDWSTIYHQGHKFQRQVHITTRTFNIITTEIFSCIYCEGIPISEFSTIFNHHEYSFIEGILFCSSMFCGIKKSSFILAKVYLTVLFANIVINKVKTFKNQANSADEPLRNNSFSLFERTALLYTYSVDQTNGKNSRI